MIKLITTTFGVGYLRPAPGTWGSLAALPLAWGIHELFGLTGFIVATAVVFFSRLVGHGPTHQRQR
jgi:phosphatidylglycerophosphatase A